MEGSAVRAIGVVEIVHTARGEAECCMAIKTMAQVPLLHVQHVPSVL